MSRHLVTLSKCNLLPPFTRLSWSLKAVRVTPAVDSTPLAAAAVSPANGVDSKRPTTSPGIRIRIANIFQVRTTSHPQLCGGKSIAIQRRRVRLKRTNLRVRGLSLNRSQKWTALLSTTPRLRPRSSTNDLAPLHRVWLVSLSARGRVVGVRQEP